LKGLTPSGVADTGAAGRAEDKDSARPSPLRQRAHSQKMLRETQLKMERQIVPLLSELDADPAGELSQTLNLAADAIERHFRGSFSIRAVVFARVGTDYKGQRHSSFGRLFRGLRRP